MLGIQDGEPLVGCRARMRSATTGTFTIPYFRITSTTVWLRSSRRLWNIAWSTPVRRTGFSLKMTMRPIKSKGKKIRKYIQLNQ